MSRVRDPNGDWSQSGFEIGTSDVFLLRVIHGSAYTPPAAVGLFAEGVTGGCGNAPLLYCPNRSVTRGQMAVFLVRAFGLI